MSDKPPRRKGRKTKLTPERMDAILKAINGGSYLSTAAAYAGVDETTVHRWMRRGESPTAPEKFRLFRRSVLKAQASAEVRLAVHVEKAAEKNWKAAAWKLSVMFPERWGPKVKVTVANELNATLDRLERGLPPQVFDQVLAVIAGDVPLLEAPKPIEGNAPPPRAEPEKPEG